MPTKTERPDRFQGLARPELGGARPNRWVRIVVVAATAVVLSCQLLVPPIVGMADNGDFSKVIGRYGLTSPAYWGYIGVRYPFEADYNYDPGFYSSEQVFVRIALAINRLRRGDGSVDVRLVGLVHGAFFLLAVALFVPLIGHASRSLQLAYCAAALLIFTDVMYASYLNSFYMDTSGLIMLLLSAVFYLRAIAWKRRADSVLFVASSLVLITSKPQHAVYGLWIAGLVWLSREPLWGGRKWAATAAAALLLVTAWTTFRFAAPRGYSANNCFNIVFLEILPHSRNVSQTMTALRLDATDRVWIGTTAYSPGSKMGDPEFSRAFSRKVSYLRLARFYLRHPGVGWEVLQSGLTQAGRERERIGNFPFGAGKGPMDESASFAIWSNLKRRLFYPHGERLLLSFLGVAGLVAALALTRRERLGPGVRAGVFVLIGTAFSEMLVASFGDAIDVVRHHLNFHAEFDMLILAALWLAASRVRGRQKSAAH